MYFVIFSPFKQSLFRFKLLDYCTTDKENGRIATIDVPENRFADWLIAYRITATATHEDTPW